MAAATINSNGGSWDWFRVGAWSGSFTVHAFVLGLVLLAAPAIVPATKPASEPVTAHLIEPAPSPPVLPEPPPPAVPHHVRSVPVRIPPQPSTPATSENVAVPPTPIADTTPAPTDSAATTPATNDADIGGGATRTLAYATPLQPRYPPASVRAREQGTVMLRVLVDQAGVPQRVEIARSSGHARLDAVARESVMHARFRPVMRNGEATSAWGLVPIEFRLDQG
jgi:protein TonB